MDQPDRADSNDQVLLELSRVKVSGGKCGRSDWRNNIRADRSRSRIVAPIEKIKVE